MSPSLPKVSVLVMCHTRELAFQISKEYERFSKYMPNVKVRGRLRRQGRVWGSECEVSSRGQHGCLYCSGRAFCSCACGCSAVTASVSESSR